MRQVCLLCGRSSPDNNLFCQETYCPAEMSPTILEYGEWLGDVEIVKPVVILRSAVLYEASHRRKKVYLKVAHPGPENKERLQREAEFIRSVQLSGKQCDTLPMLLPPYVGTSIRSDAYGQTVLGRHLLFFYMFEHFDGEPLRDVLTKNPQLWINHVGWVMISLATTVNFLHLKGRYHYGLSPDSLLVRFDEDPGVPRILLFDLGVVSDAPNLSHDWHPFAVAPAYTAPELARGGDNQVLPRYSTDVYGLGLILYEMLVGEPVFAHKFCSDQDVIRLVQRGQRVVMSRKEDASRVASIALRGIDPEPEARQATAADFAEELKAHFGSVPPPKASKWPSLHTIMVIIAALLAIAFLVAVAVSLSNVGK